MHFDPENMNREQRDAWNARVPTVTVKEPCDCCKTLQTEIKERISIYPWFKMTSCESCFAREVSNRKDQNDISRHEGLM
jgi:hypothetical protein